MQITLGSCAPFPKIGREDPLKMPQIMHAYPIDAKALSQMRADRLDQLAPADAGFDQRRRIE
jgi:hypothetical protein